MTLNFNIFTEWGMEREKWLNGEAVDQKQLLNALERKNAPPEEYYDFLAALIKQKVRFKRARKKLP